MRKICAFWSAEIDVPTTTTRCHDKAGSAGIIDSGILYQFCVGLIPAVARINVEYQMVIKADAEPGCNRELQHCF